MKLLNVNGYATMKPQYKGIVLVAILKILFKTIVFCIESSVYCVLTFFDLNRFNNNKNKNISSCSYCYKIKIHSFTFKIPFF